MILFGVQPEMLGNFFNKLHVKQKFSKLFYWQRLRKDFVHTWQIGLLDILFFNMTCDCNNFWLTFPSNINPQKQISNSLGGFISIQEWHTTIHKDKRKPKRIILINGGLDFIDRLLAIISINRLLMPPPKSKNHKESIDNFTVELFIVDH